MAVLKAEFGGDIQKVELKRDDLVVIRFNQLVTLKDAEKWVKALQDELPANKVVMLPTSASISVLSWPTAG